MLAALAIAAIAMAFDVGVAPIGLVGMIVAIIAFVAACLAIHFITRGHSAALDRTALDELPAQTDRWLEQQRPLLPHAAGTLLDSISRRLGEMGPQLTSLDPHQPGADAVRRLLATHLPALVRGYEEVPESLRALPGTGEVSADAHLLQGLTTIDAEIARMIEQLARGAFDELATQNRFLETRYEGASSLR